MGAPYLEPRIDFAQISRVVYAVEYTRTHTSDMCTSSRHWHGVKRCVAHLTDYSVFMAALTALEVTHSPPH